MSINLGQAGTEAVRNLHGNGDFQMFRAALEEQVRKYTYELLEIEPVRVEHGRGYAKAVFDLYRAVEAAATGGRQTAVAKPPPPASARVSRPQPELPLNAPA